MWWLLSNCGRFPTAQSIPGVLPAMGIPWEHFPAASQLSHCLALNSRWLHRKGFPVKKPVISSWMSGMGIYLGSNTNNPHIQPFYIFL